MGHDLPVAALQHIFTCKAQLQPRPLRSVQFPFGFPWLSAANKQLVDRDNLLVAFCWKLAEAQCQQQHFFLVEHPEDLGVCGDSRPGSIWQWPAARRLLDAGARTYAVHQCCYGSQHLKPTRFLSNLMVSHVLIWLAGTQGPSPDPVLSTKSTRLCSGWIPAQENGPPQRPPHTLTTFGNHCFDSLAEGDV